MSDKMEELIGKIEAKGYEWEVGFTEGQWDATVWEGYIEKGKYITEEREPAYDMLKKAAIGAGVDLGE
jgi:hypothetical protein